LAEDTADSVLTPQVLEVCRNTHNFLTENIRTSRRFLSSLKLGLVIEDLKLEELSKKTPDAALDKLLAPLKQGIDIGIISEAGCPAVADPGARAVAWAHQNGVKVSPLVGPNSILLALMGSGLGGQKFQFHGYLPVKRAERKKAIQELERLADRGTQLFMETPYRNQPLLEDLVATCQPDTLLCIAANITASTEYIHTKPIAHWKKQLPDLHKQPAIFALGRSSK
jgi:16S rRNA (cytidine1402-2'-O)-methyltransferase